MDGHPSSGYTTLRLGQLSQFYYSKCYEQHSVWIV